MRRILFTGSVPNQIPERLFHILLVLLEANGCIVTRQELATRVWGEEGVTDSNLTQHIYLLRMLLGERKRERLYIVTVPGRGYRLAATVTVRHGEEALQLSEAFEGRAVEGNFDAFRHYCQASYLLERRTATSLLGAVDAFESALTADPDYTPAHIGLARTHAFLALYWHVPAKDALVRARAAIARALELEPHSAAAHAMLSEILLFGQWNWLGALEEIQAAVALNPQSTLARTNATWYYVAAGDYTNALRHAKQALLMEPASLGLLLLLSRVAMHAGDYEQAADGMTRILTSEPGYAIARRYRAMTYLFAGKPDLAIDDVLALGDDDRDDVTFRVPLLARAYADMGDLKRSREIAARLDYVARNRYVTWWNRAIVAMGLRRVNETLTYLRNALENREPAMIFIKSLPWFEPISGLPEFKRLRSAVGP